MNNYTINDIKKSVECKKLKLNIKCFGIGAPVVTTFFLVVLAMTITETYRSISDYILPICMVIVNLSALIFVISKFRTDKRQLAYILNNFQKFEYHKVRLNRAKKTIMGVRYDVIIKLEYSEKVAKTNPIFYGGLNDHPFQLRYYHNSLVDGLYDSATNMFFVIKRTH